jgi:hypothetical protein
MVRKNKAAVEEEVPIVNTEETTETQAPQTEEAPVDTPAETTVEAPVDTKADETSTEVESTPETETESKAVEEEVPAEKPVLTDIPDKAKAYLKRHTEVKEIYIDKLGGVYPSDTPKVFVKNATLYQNPYFKL